ncbi:hypothetical protein JB92DRAFT_1990577 [Gautieria morchelliformis]|nr:hypothetical protein JB92DRAFT_1990577 [Gautieria morchelliformis]
MRPTMSSSSLRSATPTPNAPRLPSRVNSYDGSTPSHRDVSVSYPHICSESLSNKSVPWLTLNVKCPHTARTESSLIPLYKKPRSAIPGEIVLMLDKPEAIHAVKVSIRGTSSFDGDESAQGGRWATSIRHQDTFMDVTQTLWSSSEGMPKIMEFSQTPKDGKLQGKFTFHFTLHLPKALPLDPSQRGDPLLHSRSLGGSEDSHHSEDSRSFTSSHSGDSHSFTSSPSGDSHEPSHDHAPPPHHHTKPSHDHAQWPHHHVKSSHPKAHSSQDHPVQSSYPPSGASRPRSKTSHPHAQPSDDRAQSPHLQSQPLQDTVKPVHPNSQISRHLAEHHCTEISHHRKPPPRLSLELSAQDAQSPHRDGQSSHPHSLSSHLSEQSPQPHSQPRPDLQSSHRDEQPPQPHSHLPHHLAQSSHTYSHPSQTVQPLHPHSQLTHHHVHSEHALSHASPHDMHSPYPHSQLPQHRAQSTDSHPHHRMHSANPLSQLSHHRAQSPHPHSHHHSTDSLSISHPLEEEPSHPHVTCDLPGSWWNKRSPVSFDYQIVVTVVRGALKANTSLNMDFYYAPHSRPDRPSLLRQKAYALGSLAPDPSSDPVGWHTVSPPGNVKGKLADGRSVEVVCTFSLAKPLCYSRGKFIPVSLAVQCLDTSALDLLQSPLAVSVFLLQYILTGKNAQSDKLRSPRDVKMIPIARAVCWHSSASAGEWDDCRTLTGEIALPEKMPATSILPKVRVEYHVVMLPLDVDGFTPSDPHSFVVDQPVRITTHDSDAPSCSQVPPGSANPQKDDKDSFQQMMNALAIMRR